jgi:hypothetical protein
MNIQINPDAMFSTSETGRMLDIKPDRIKNMCDRSMIPCTKANPDFKGGRYGHWRIKFSDFPKIVEADKRMRKLGVNPRTDAMKQRIADLEARVEWLEKAFDQYTAPEVAQEPMSR